MLESKQHVSRHSVSARDLGCESLGQGCTVFGGRTCDECEGGGAGRIIVGRHSHKHSNRQDCR